MIKPASRRPVTLLSAIPLFTMLLLLTLFSLSPAANEPQETRQLTRHTSKADLTSSVTPRTLHQILQQIDTYYVDKVNINQLLEKAIQEVFKQLDPHSGYLNAKELKSLFDLANGQYTGLGIEVEIRNGLLVILATLKNSPAEYAGLQKGDIVQTINGIAVAEKDLEEVTELIRQSGQKTALSVTRDFYDKALEFVLEKADIAVESVTGRMLDNDIAYLKIYSFQSNTTAELEQQVQRLKKQANHPLKGLLLDLRDNPGGVLESAVGVSDLFLDKGTIVTTRGRFNDANRNFYATPGDILPQRPLYILINKGSASASEIVAAALKENHRATIIGMQSYGKGSVQSLIPLGDGHTAIKLTTALYYTPDGLSINGVGITPDVEIPQQQDDKDSGSIPNSENHWGLSGNMLANRDFQLDAAQKLVLQHLVR